MHIVGDLISVLAFDSNDVCLCYNILTYFLRLQLRLMYFSTWQQKIGEI